MGKVTFDDKTIQGLFGFEDAESEPINRLKEYYFKKDTFDRITTELPVRILVGHKGTGKSALFKVAMSEEKDNGNLPILIKPDDIAEFGKDDENFLLRIKQWKYGLTKIIGEKVFAEFGITDDTLRAKLSQFGLKLSKFIIDSVSFLKDSVDLQESQKALIASFLKKKKIVVYIDYLDRGWEGKKDDIIRVSALLNSVRDLANDNDGLLFKISLRSDVYFLVRTSDESTDKIEGSVVWCTWTNHEIFALLIKRVLTFFNKPANDDTLIKTDQRYLAHDLDSIIDHNFKGKGKWSNVPTYRILMSMIRKRPRDLVKLCSLAAHEACKTKSQIIKTEHFEAIFEEYSQGRIQDTINEYKSELPNIADLIFGMKPTKKSRIAGDGYVYTTSELMAKIGNVCQNKNFILKNGAKATPQELAQFLYKINFLTARKQFDDGEIQRRYFEENRYLSSVFVDFGYDWEVHPAFRWALQPDDINDIFQKLTLS